MSFLKLVAKKILLQAPKLTKPASSVSLHHLSIHGSSDEDIEKRFEMFFNRPDLDGWDVRQGMNDLFGMDMVPDPKTCIAALYAARRVNDYSMCVRFLEAVKDKCGGKADEIYPYVIQEITPVLCELGIDTPEGLGYDKPELYCKNVFDMHED